MRSLAVFLFLSCGAAEVQDRLSASIEIADATNDDRRRYVLSYNQAVSLDDVEAVLDSLGASLERPLTCTRGLLISFDRDDILDTTVGYEGFKLLPIPSGSNEHHLSVAHMNNLQAVEEHDEEERQLMKSSKKKNKCKCKNFDDVYKNKKGKNKGKGKGGNKKMTVWQVEEIKELIKQDIAMGANSYAGSESDSIGELLRLTFHDTSPFDIDNDDKYNLSGLNGCVDLSFSSNAGLQSAIAFLTEIKSNSGIAISFADLIVLGGIAAVEAAGGPSIPFKYGRIDVPCECETNFFPNPESTAAQTTAELDTSMRDRLGLTRREITALLGSHTVGRLEVGNSGYSGGWIPPANRSTFNNLYYIVMLNRPWVLTKKEIRGKELTEWRSPLVEIDAMMLNIDAILGFEIDDGCNVFGLDPLDFLTTGNGTSAADFVPADIVNCTVRTDEYGQAVQDFSIDNDLWLQEYEAAFVKMVETTVPCGELSDPED